MPEVYESPDTEFPQADYLDEDSGPDEISQFVEGLGLGEKFRCSIRRRKPNGDGFYILSDFKNRVPRVEEIGKRYGDGEYLVTFTWYPPRNAPKGGGKVGSVIKELSLDLPEVPWRREHVKYMAELKERDMQEERERKTRMREEAALTHIATSGGAAPGGLDQVKAAIELLRDLGISPGVKQGPDWDKIIAFAGTILPVILPMFQRKESISMGEIITLMQNNQNNLLTLMNRRSPAEENMLGFVNQAVQTASQIMKLQAGKPPEDAETESWADRIMGLIESVGPAVIQAIAAKPPEARAKNPLYNMAVNSADMKALSADKNKLIAVVNRLDEKYGCQATDGILEAFSELGIERPPETEVNRELYTSPGAEGEGEDAGQG